MNRGFFIIQILSFIHPIPNKQKPTNDSVLLHFLVVHRVYLQ